MPEPSGAPDPQPIATAGGGRAIASIPRRGAAFAVDVVLLVGVLAVVFVAGAGGGSEDVSARLRERPISLNLTLDGIVLAYFLAAEATTGRTIGKGLLGLRVVRLDGSPAGPLNVLVRTLGRIPDHLAATPLVAVLCMLLTRPRVQRLGDLAAGTLVVRART